MGSSDAADRVERIQALRRLQHRSVSIPDLIVAATAERNSLTVLRYDADYDRISAITGQPAQWIVECGSADRSG